MSLSDHLKKLERLYESKIIRGKYLDIYCNIIFTIGINNDTRHSGPLTLSQLYTRLENHPDYVIGIKNKKIKRNTIQWMLRILKKTKLVETFEDKVLEDLDLEEKYYEKIEDKTYIKLTGEGKNIAKEIIRKNKIKKYRIGKMMKDLECKIERIKEENGGSSLEATKYLF